MSCVLLYSSVVAFWTVALLYRSKVTVSVEDGCWRPVTVALSAIDEPTVADAGCWLVLIDGEVGPA
jgi:hypothetical protein